MVDLAREGVELGWNDGVSMERRERRDAAPSVILSSPTNEDGRGINKRSGTRRGRLMTLINQLY